MLKQADIDGLPADLRQNWPSYVTSTLHQYLITDATGTSFQYSSVASLAGDAIAIAQVDTL